MIGFVNEVSIGYGAVIVSEESLKRGAGSLGGAFQYVTQIGVVLLFVNLKDR